YHEVALADAAEAFALPAQFGLSAPGGLLGGALPGYRIYEAAPAGGTPTHVAFAALEPHFMARAMQLLGVDGTEEQFAATFKTKTAAEWEAWGIEQDVPIAEVRGAGRVRN
ncbi:MAG TPA: CoA transferase, partial [Corynebacterium sp.]